MNISQALRQVRQIRGNLSTWASRLSISVQWTDDNVPAYPFAECQEHINGLRSDLVSLRTRITHANATNFIEVPGIGQITLTEATIRLSELRSEIAEFTGLRTATREQWTTEQTRMNRQTYVDEVVGETVNHCSLITRDRDQHVVDLNDQFQQINALLEAANHRVEV